MAEKIAKKEKHRIRILSYNIHKGFSSGNRKFILKGIREALRETHPEVVFLQEVLGNHDGHRKRIQDWPTESQFEFLADELWPHFAYGRNAVYTMGHHGNAILSKHPILFFENIDISTNHFERRGILHGMIKIPGISRSVHLLCVHLGLMEAERLTQIKKLCSRVHSHVPDQDPLIIGGDFNDWTGKASHLLEKSLHLEELFKKVQGQYARTFPSWLPALKLDRLYCRGFEVKSAECLSTPKWAGLSDHVALLGEVGI